MGKPELLELKGRWRWRGVGLVVFPGRPSLKATQSILAPVESSKVIRMVT